MSFQKGKSNCAMQLVKDPGQFDVILTENMFGDILSDEASMVTGSIGMLPSASLGETKLGLYEPSHGSAPEEACLSPSSRPGKMTSLRSRSSTSQTISTCWRMRSSLPTSAIPLKDTASIWT